MAHKDLTVFGEEYEYENHIADAVVRGVIVRLEDHLTGPVPQDTHDAIAGKIADAWPDSGPYTLDTMYHLNRLHATAVEDGTGYSLSFMPNRNEFAIQTIDSGLQQTETKSDSLFAAIMGTRKALQVGE